MLRAYLIKRSSDATPAPIRVTGTAATVVKRFSARTIGVSGMDRHARVRGMVEEHIQLVTRTLRNAGVPPADLDDEVQRTFIIAARRLDDVKLGAERAFLCQVALNLAWHARRSLARRREIPCDQVPEPLETCATPEELIDRMQMRQQLEGIVDRMDQSLRAVFTLFVIDEMNLAEIATLLRVPRGTVASRLRRAREQLRRHVGAIELASTLGAKGVKRIDEPVPTWRKKLGALERTLLHAGAWMPPWPRMRAKTLAGLGLV